jgi:hypothetical protein
MHDRQNSQVLQRCCGYETQGPCDGHRGGRPSHSGITLIGHGPPASRLDCLREGFIFSTTIGAFIIGVLNNEMVLLSLPTFYQMGAES